jgi:hypothetical protein
MISAATRTTFIAGIQNSLIATLDSGSGAVSKAEFLAFGESAAVSYPRSPLNYRRGQVRSAGIAC